MNSKEFKSIIVGNEHLNITRSKMAPKQETHLEPSKNSFSQLIPALNSNSTFLQTEFNYILYRTSLA